MTTRAESDALADSRPDSTAVRTVHGLLLAALLVGLVAADWYLGERVSGCRYLVFAAVLAGLVGVGLAEFYRLAARAGAAPAAGFGVVCGVLLVAAQWVGGRLGSAWPAPGIDPVIAVGTAAVFGSVAAQYLRRGVEDAWLNISTTLLGLALIWFLTSFLWGIRQFGIGPVILFAGAVKLSDVGAYFVGRAVGGRRLAPVLSPKKTVSGAVGGVAAGTLVGLGFGLGLPEACAGLGVAQAAAFGGVLAVFGIVGDLGESLLKRAASVKDASGLLPGFGGILDLVDSVLGAAPAAYVLFVLWGTK